MATKKTLEKEETDHWFNEGRQNADRKWIDAINERIAELEKETGITELKRMKEKTRYRWKD